MMDSLNIIEIGKTAHTDLCNHFLGNATTFLSNEFQKIVLFKVKLH